MLPVVLLVGELLVPDWLAFHRVRVMAPGGRTQWGGSGWRARNAVRRQARADDNGGRREAHSGAAEHNSNARGGMLGVQEGIGPPKFGQISKRGIKCCLFHNLRYVGGGTKVEVDKARSMTTKKSLSFKLLQWAQSMFHGASAAGKQVEYCRYTAACDLIV